MTNATAEFSRYISGMKAGRLELARMGVQRWVLLRLLERGRSSDGEKPEHLQVGDRGELEAMFFLRREGFLVLERRWRSPELNGDIDLVAWEGPTLCVVEVKTRRSRGMTPAAAAVNATKQRMLQQMAESYKRSLPASERTTLVTRFDVVSVYLMSGEVQCELVRDAF